MKHLPVIYFMQDIASGLIKIGYTTGLRGRFRSFTRASTQGIRFLGMMFGGPQHEMMEHEAWSHLHHHGEWFRPEPDLMQFIATKTVKTWRELYTGMSPAECARYMHDQSKVIRREQAKFARLHEEFKDLHGRKYLRQLKLDIKDFLPPEPAIEGGV